MTDTNRLAPLTMLYVPADRGDRIPKAAQAGADCLIIDLEDAVAPANKALGRNNIAQFFSTEPLDATGRTHLIPPALQVQVRIGQLGSEDYVADTQLINALPPFVQVRVPKVETAADVEKIVSDLPGRKLHLLIESALGVENAYQIACANPAIVSLGLGEADLRSELKIVDENALSWIRTRIVVAAKAAGLLAPALSVFANIADQDGLLASTIAGRNQGFYGRAAIHPKQISTIKQAFRPTENEIHRAQLIIKQVATARQQGNGTATLDDGTFLDIAMVEQAQGIIELAEKTQ